MRDPIRSSDERFEIRHGESGVSVVHLDSDTAIATYPRGTDVSFTADGKALLVAEAKVEIDYLMKAAEAASRGESLVTMKEFEIRRTAELNPYVEMYGDGEEEQSDFTFEVIHSPSKKVVATYSGWRDHTGTTSGTQMLTFSEDGLALMVDGDRVELAELLGRNGPRALRRKKKR